MAAPAAVAAVAAAVAAAGAAALAATDSDLHSQFCPLKHLAFTRAFFPPTQILNIYSSRLGINNGLENILGA